MKSKKINQKFENWLYDNTVLQNSSIRLYCSLVKQHIEVLLLSIEKKNVNIINRLLIREHRNKNNIVLKFAIVHYLRFMGLKEWIIDLVKLKRKPKKKMGSWLSSFEIDQVLKKLPFIYAVAFRIQYETGLRIREVLGLKKSNVEFLPLQKKARIMVKTKSQKSIIKFITIDSYNSLERMSTVDDYYFLQDNGKGFESSIRSTYNRFSEAFKDAGKKAINKNINTHDIRRSVAQRIVQQDSSMNGLFKAQRFLGHSSPDVTFKYLNDNNMFDNF